ncbi:MAG: pilus assembly protein TadG-related protein [Actinomycetes bacterium]|jgi:hypothetical protein
MARSHKHDDGFISAFVVSLTMTFIVCAGLAIDGGRVVAARIKVADTAENAARAGAQALTDLRTGAPRIDAPQAIRLSQSYLRSVQTQGRVEANRIEVCVTISAVEQMSLLRLAGIETRTVTATRCAQPVVG